MFVLSHQFAKIVSAEELAAKTEYATVCTSCGTNTGTGALGIISGSSGDDDCSAQVDGC